MQHKEQPHTGPQHSQLDGPNDSSLSNSCDWVYFHFVWLKTEETDKRENKKSKISKGTKNKTVCIHLAAYLDTVFTW